MTDALNAYLAPIRKKFEDPALAALTKAAYPENLPSQPVIAPMLGLDDDETVAAAAAAATAAESAGKGKKAGKAAAKPTAAPAAAAESVPAPAAPSSDPVA